MAESDSLVALPEIGQAVHVRNRIGVIRAVDAYDSKDEQGTLHLVTVEYLDDWQFPESDQLLWEVETTAKVIGSTVLPRIDEAGSRPDDLGTWQAFINSHRWSRVNRLRAVENVDAEPILSIWNSAIQVHSYQLEPVLRALEMPRVSLLLADGVGLGKTIQSGLVLEELLLRRRIRRVLVLCPAMLQRQWKYELRRKFNLEFEVIDSDSTFQLRRRFGIDTNPWKAFPRIITSMDYLRMPDVLDQFMSASGSHEEVSGKRLSPTAPWDLLIVDEAHHFSPQSGQRASQRTHMLREVRFLFEHRIFASATPHNGKTVCFTGLLELLDPVRFQMVAEMGQADKENLKEVRIRRLKEDINRQQICPPFSEQKDPVELPFTVTPKERELFDALRTYRESGQKLIAPGNASERWLCQFIFSLHTKRLLSCPYAFARTWWRHLGEADQDQEQVFAMARVSAQHAEDQARSDDEKSQYEEDSARHSGTWFRKKRPSLSEAQDRISKALAAIGYSREALGADITTIPGNLSDSKTEALITWIKANLFKNGSLRNDERLIVFTEYKETLQYLEKRFIKEGFDKNTMRLIYGGMDANEFEAVKNDFEDPASAVRLLLATDAASEGVNMQECCRWVIHFDVPWSPSKLQQRNGRVSRHGQVRDVFVHYFRCNQEEDIDFLFRVAQKVEQIRQDLGSVERIFDAAIQRHFQGQTVSFQQLGAFVDQEIKVSPQRVELGQSSEADIKRLTERATSLLENTDRRLGISSDALKDLLEAAINVEGNGELQEIPGRPGFFRFKPPPRWEALAKQTLTVGDTNDRMELVFDPVYVTADVPSEDGTRNYRILRLKKHQALMRLAHPIMRQAVMTLTRQLHEPSGVSPVQRWSIAALHKSNFDALLLFHYTVTAINDLREPLHDEVCTAVFRVSGDQLSRVDSAFEQEILNAQLLKVKSAKRVVEQTQLFTRRWVPHRKGLEQFLADQKKARQVEFKKLSQAALKHYKDEASKNYRYRLKELQEHARSNNLEKLAQKLVEEEQKIPSLFPDMQADNTDRVKELEVQVELLKRDVDHTRKQLEEEQRHRLDTLLPKRFSILGEVRILPLALVYLIPATKEDLKS